MFSDNQQVSGFSGDVSEYAQIEAAYGGLEGGQTALRESKSLLPMDELRYRELRRLAYCQAQDIVEFRGGCRVSL